MPLLHSASRFPCITLPRLAPQKAAPPDFCIPIYFPRGSLKALVYWKFHLKRATDNMLYIGCKVWGDKYRKKKYCIYQYRPTSVWNQWLSVKGLPWIVWCGVPYQFYCTIPYRWKTLTPTGILIERLSMLTSYQAFRVATAFTLSFNSFSRFSIHRRLLYPLC